jgi:hypothetical protein
MGYMYCTQLDEKKETNHKKNKSNHSKEKKKINFKKWNRRINNFVVSMLETLPYFRSYISPLINKYSDDIMYMMNLLFCVICCIVHFCLKFYYEYKNMTWTFNSFEEMDRTVSVNILSIIVPWFLYATFVIINVENIIFVIIGETKIPIITLLNSIIVIFISWILSLPFVSYNKTNHLSKVVNILFIVLFFFNFLINCIKSSSYIRVYKNKKESFVIYLNNNDGNYKSLFQANESNNINI